MREVGKARLSLDMARLFGIVRAGDAIEPTSPSAFLNRHGAKRGVRAMA
jgi:hypothetical protein